MRVGSFEHWSCSTIFRMILKFPMFLWDGSKKTTNQIHSQAWMVAPHHHGEVPGRSHPRDLAGKPHSPYPTASMTTYDMCIYIYILYRMKLPWSPIARKMLGRQWSYVHIIYPSLYPKISQDTFVSSLTPGRAQDYVHRIGRTARGPYGQGHAWSTQRLGNKWWWLVG